MYKVKNEHFDIETDLEYLIKPDVCPDWASSIEILSGKPERDFMMFTHAKVFHGKCEGHENALFLEISNEFRFSEKMLEVLRNHSDPDYEGIRLSYGTPSKESIDKPAETFKGIDFKGFLKVAFHCEAISITRYKSTLFLVFSDVELAINKEGEK